MKAAATKAVSTKAAATKAVAAKPAPAKKLSAGGEIDSWCTRCRMDLGHRIVAMVGAMPKRVICQTCGSEHNFRAAAGSTLARAAGPRPAGKAARGDQRPKPTAARKQELARAEWEARISSGEPLRSYRPTDRFAVGDLLQHPKFGDGYVSSLISPNKFTIAFSTGERTLIHAAEA